MGAAGHAGHEHRGCEPCELQCGVVELVVLRGMGIEAGNQVGVLAMGVVEPVVVQGMGIEAASQVCAKTGGTAMQVE